MKHSPLEPAHLEAGARMVDFAGWFMPVQYSSIKEEHDAVRSAVGIFDVSHMGEIFVSGEGAAEWLETLLTNRLGKLALGRGQYTLMLNEEGGVIDDLIIYRTGEKEFLLVINAGRRSEDLAWFEKYLPRNGSVLLEDRSDAFAAFALQGPKAEELLRQILPGVELPKRNGIVDFLPNSTSTANCGVVPVLAPSSIPHTLTCCAPSAPGTSSAEASLEGSLIPGVEGFIARTGYTGEDGFEIFVSNEDGLVLWRKLVAAGATPCGLGARDTLRLEMGYPLNGSDLSMTRTPLEAGLEKFLSLEDPLKGNFIGRAALEKQRAAGLAMRLTPLKMSAGGPPLRSHYPIYSGEKLLGEITSGAFSPSLGEGIAMAYLPIAFTQPETVVEVEVRGRRFQAVVTTLPFS